jgi:hypothetical protein
MKKKVTAPGTPGRIVCLSAESADWLWRIGAWEQVAGVTACFRQPAGAVPKPRVSGFSTAKLDEIAALEPDLVITFSDVQAEFTAELMRRGFPLLGTSQRTFVVPVDRRPRRSHQLAQLCFSASEQFNDAVFLADDAAVAVIKTPPHSFPPSSLPRGPWLGTMSQ